MAETAQICTIMNYKLNELKAARPNDKAIIEAFQTAMVNKADIISPNSRRALLKFPMQFVQPIRTSDGEWTTQLHIWAGLQLRDLLRIDPIVLTAKDSNYDSVLKTLVQAALGKSTQVVNYQLIEELLQKNMCYNAVTVPGDTENTEPGNAWYEQDIEGKTVAEYLYDYASGEGDFKGNPPDEHLLALFSRYADTALHLEGEDISFGKVKEDEPKEDEQTPEMVPNEEGAAQQTEKLDDTDSAVELDENGNYRPKEPEEGETDGKANGDQTQNLLKVLMKLGSLLQ